MEFRPPRPPCARRWLGAACLALAAACTGCGDGRPEVYPVEGQVFAGARPAARGTITFHPAGGTAEQYRPTGRIDEQGKFKLTTFKEGDGAPAGEYRVTVVWYLATRQSAQEDPVPVNYLPPRYASAETSPLRATVGKGTNTIEPFRLAAR